MSDEGLNDKPAHELAIDAPLGSALQQVKDEDGNGSALSLSSNHVYVRAADELGIALPVTIEGTAIEGSWGRLIRLQSPQGAVFDIGIDQNGNLFLNGRGSTIDKHLVTISLDGRVTFGC